MNHIEQRELHKRRSSRRIVTRGTTLVFILLFFTQLITGSLKLSLTSDEPPHTAHGYLLLTTGDTWALSEHRHPPLLNMLTALPLLLQPERPDPKSLPGWHQDFVIFVRNLWPLLGPVDRQAFVTRLPNMLLAVILMALVYRWAHAISNLTGAIVAIAVMAFDPTLIAHSQLNTTDIGVTLFTFAAIYLATQTHLTLPSTIATGALLGAALASKGSGVLLIPVILGILLQRHVTSTNHAHSYSHWLLVSGIVLSTGFAVLWATYGFRLEPSPWPGLRLPLISHLKMVELILHEKQRTAFLMGHLRWGGWWWYFPLAFAIKTPLPLIALLVAAMVNLITQPQQLLRRTGVWAYPLLYIGTSILSGMNIGYRHLLPIFPFSYVIIASLAQRLSRTPTSPKLCLRSAHIPTARLTATVIIFLILWQATEAIMIYPFDIAYFNELIGGPRQGYRYLVDSNVDWGQSFKALSNYMQQEKIDKVWLSYYTWIDPAQYGVSYWPLPPAGGPATTLQHPFNPAPGVYAISATPLQGVMMADPDLYAWFRERTPDAQPGYGLLVYRVRAAQSRPTWIAQCSQPTIPLPKHTITSGFGRSDLRQIVFDCTQGWILPTGGNQAGWYVIHGATAPNPFVKRQLARLNATLSYRQREPRSLPSFSIYAQPKAANHPSIPLEPQIPFGAITLLGYDIEAPSVRAGEYAEIRTWWRVNSIPSRPLSLMLHIGTPNAPPISVGDGLAVPIETWHTGDILIQRHILAIPESATTGHYAAIVGVYWLDTLQRWAVTAGPHAGNISVTLGTIEIRGR